MPKKENSTNGEKNFYLRIIFISLSVILGLVATVWGLTWFDTKQKVVELKEETSIRIEEVKSLSSKACEENDDQNIRIERLEGNYRHINKKLDEIIGELKKGE